MTTFRYLGAQIETTDDGIYRPNTLIINGEMCSMELYAEHHSGVNWRASASGNVLMYRGESGKEYTIPQQKITDSAQKPAPKKKVVDLNNHKADLFEGRKVVKDGMVYWANMTTREIYAHSEDEEIAGSISGYKVADIMDDWTISAHGLSIDRILNRYGLTISDISKKFGIPYRTVQNWTAKGVNRRECPEYVLRMMETILSTEKLSR